MALFGHDRLGLVVSATLCTGEATPAVRGMEWLVRSKVDYTLDYPDLPSGVMTYPDFTLYPTL